MTPLMLNDTHSRLNPTPVQSVFRPASTAELLRRFRRTPDRFSIGGGRHAMGGQQFGEGTVHLDTRGLDRLLSFDAAQGLVNAEAGIQWPALIDGIRRMNERVEPQWGIRQKQTGASDLTLGGALAANAHGRGLAMRPMIDDVESFTLIDAVGEIRRCSRLEHPDLFSLAIGGYGLFGVFGEITLRLSRRRKVERVVDVISTDDAIGRLEHERDRGTIYGDFQFDIDHRSGGFMRRGVFSRYRPVPDETPIPEGQRVFTPDLWLELLRLARTDKSRAFDRYAAYYASTSGQVYHTDTHQLSTYVPGYHEKLGDLPDDARGTEMITELYVPRDAFLGFMRGAADAIRQRDARITYGTVRLIERDRQSFLPWACDDYACVVLNVLTAHSERGIGRSRDLCRALIDLSLSAGGSFFLTYHRWARADQVRRAYPAIGAFLDAKRRHDPGGRFTSTWHRWLEETLADDARAPGGPVPGAGPVQGVSPVGS